VSVTAPRSPRSASLSTGGRGRTPGKMGHGGHKRRSLGHGNLIGLHRNGGTREDKA